MKVCKNKIPHATKIEDNNDFTEAKIPLMEKSFFPNPGWDLQSVFQGMENRIAFFSHIGRRIRYWG